MARDAARVDGEQPSGPRSRKGIRTRARLLEAAKHVFEDQGFLDARISDIAERAGLSHGSFYHYFDSKEQVFREVAEMLDEQMAQPLGEVLLDPSSGAAPADRIREAIRRHLESYRREARIMGVIEQVSRYDEHVHGVLAARYRQYTKQIADSIVELQRRGLVDRTLDPLITAAALGAMVARFAEMWLAQRLLSVRLDDAVEHLTKVFVNALRLEERPPARRPPPS